MLPDWYIASFSRRRRTVRKYNRHRKFPLVISIVVFMRYQRCILSGNFLSSCFNVGTKWPWRIESWTVCSTYRLVRTTRAAWRRVSDCVKSPGRHLLRYELLQMTARKSVKCLIHKMVTKSFVANYFDSPLIYEAHRFPGNRESSTTRSSVQQPVQLEMSLQRSSAVMF